MASTPSSFLVDEFGSMVHHDFLAMMERHLDIITVLMLLGGARNSNKGATPESIKALFPGLDPSHLMEYYYMSYIVINIQMNHSESLGEEFQNELNRISENWIQSMEIVPEGPIDDPNFTIEDANGITEVMLVIF